MVGVDTSLPQGQDIYRAAVEELDIPDGRIGVPTLIIDDIVLVGSGEIPDQFPGLIEEYLEQGGVDFPDISGLQNAIEQERQAEATQEADLDDSDEEEVSEERESREGDDENDQTSQEAVSDTTDSDEERAESRQSTEENGDTDGDQDEGESEDAGEDKEDTTIASAAATATPTSGLILPESRALTVVEKVARDPVGNTLAIIVLLAMVGTAGYVGMTFRRPLSTPPASWRIWSIPVLSLIGFGVAAYLSYVEMSQVMAVCGPVGDCNTVQQSPYAMLFGVLPVGVLGAVGYVLILLAAAVGQFAQGRLEQIGWLAATAMVAAGTLFSIYLTFLEPFVIGATCAWCLASAIIMTLLLWIIAPLGRQALWLFLQSDGAEDEIEDKIEDEIEDETEDAIEDK